MATAASCSVATEQNPLPPDLCVGSSVGEIENRITATISDRPPSGWLAQAVGVSGRLRASEERGRTPRAWHGARAPSSNRGKLQEVLAPVTGHPRRAVATYGYSETTANSDVPFQEGRQPHQSGDSTPLEGNAREHLASAHEDHLPRADRRANLQSDEVDATAEHAAVVRSRVPPHLVVARGARLVDQDVDATTAQVVHGQPDVVGPRDRVRDDGLED